MLSLCVCVYVSLQFVPDEITGDLPEFKFFSKKSRRPKPPTGAAAAAAAPSTAAPSAAASPAATKPPVKEKKKNQSTDSRFKAPSLPSSPAALPVLVDLPRLSPSSFGGVAAPSAFASPPAPSPGPASWPLAPASTSPSVDHADDEPWANAAAAFHALFGGASLHTAALADPVAPSDPSVPLFPMATTASADSLPSSPDWTFFDAHSHHPLFAQAAAIAAATALDICPSSDNALHLPLSSADPGSNARPLKRKRPESPRHDHHSHLDHLASLSFFPPLHEDVLVTSGSVFPSAPPLPPVLALFTS